MRNLSAGFTTATQNRARSIGWLMTITLPDGTVKRLNSFGQNSFTWPESGGDVYSGDPGFNISNMTFSDGAAPPTVEIERGLDGSTPLTFTEAVSGIAESATVELIAVDFNTFASHTFGSKWRISNIRTTREGRVTFDIISSARKSRQLYLRTFSPGCQHKLGDSGCNVDLGPFTETITVSSAPSSRTLVISGPSPLPADDYFNMGALKFTSGNNNGIAYEVLDWDQSTATLTLAVPVKRDVSAGDTATLHPGCDKSTGASGCGRYSNIERRFAFDHLPDKTIDVPQQPPEPVETTGGGKSWGGFIG